MAKQEKTLTTGDEIELAYQARNLQKRDEFIRQDGTGHKEVRIYHDLVQRGRINGGMLAETNGGLDLQPFLVEANQANLNGNGAASSMNGLNPNGAHQEQTFVQEIPRPKEVITMPFDLNKKPSENWNTDPIDQHRSIQQLEGLVAAATARADDLVQKLANLPGPETDEEYEDLINGLAELVEFKENVEQEFGINDQILVDLDQRIEGLAAAIAGLPKPKTDDEINALVKTEATATATATVTTATTGLQNQINDLLKKFTDLQWLAGGAAAAFVIMVIVVIIRTR